MYIQQWLQLAIGICIGCIVSAVCQQANSLQLLKQAVQEHAL